MPLEVLGTALCDAVMNIAHVLYHLLLYFTGTLDVKVRQEVISHGNQCFFRPSLEPIHGAARNKAGEFQRA